jgi:hypothetical protein
VKRQSGSTLKARWSIACVVAAVGSLLMFAASAGAVTYTAGTPLPAGVPAGDAAIYGAADVAVDQTTGELYAADPYAREYSSGAIAHLSQAGALLNNWEEESSEFRQIGVAYDPTLNVIYAVKLHFEQAGPRFIYEIGAYEDNGTKIPLSGFPITVPFVPHAYAGGGGVASTYLNLELDPSGDIYLANRGSTVYKFDHETGATLETLTCADCLGRANFEAPSSVAVDTNGFIYVADQGNEEENEMGRVVKLNPDGSFNSVLTEYEPVPGFGSSGLAVGVDPTTNDVFLGLGTQSTFHIRAFNAVGEEVADFGAGTITEPAFAAENQIGVYGATGTVYVSDSNGAAILRVFTPDSELLAETLNSEVAGPSSATVNGIVNPNGQATTECKFEYGPTAAYGESAPCATSPGSASIRTPVSADLSGLESGAEYHYRVLEKTGSGTVSGADETFTTPLPPKPQASTGSASGISQKEATLSGMVNPEGGVTSCEFEYGTTSSYGSSVPCAEAPGSGELEVEVSAALSGLTANTTYHFRLSATNGGGTTQGKDGTFTTLVDTCATNAALCPPVEGVKPPPPPPHEGEGHKATYGQCIKSANNAYKKALKKARSKHGKAHAKAIAAAKKHKRKAIAQCKARFH